MMHKTNCLKVIRNESKKIVIILMMKPKENFSKIDPRRKTIFENKKESRYKAFDEVKNCGMINPFFLKSKALKIMNYSRRVFTRN